uniref:Uncharacterized protein n=1 Tax=Corvus moneduloides TaxID=1196302 RepID=A0A8U7PA06_CORMO
LSPLCLTAFLPLISCPFYSSFLSFSPLTFPALFLSSHFPPFPPHISHPQFSLFLPRAGGNGSLLVRAMAESAVMEMPACSLRRTLESQGILSTPDHSAGVPLCSEAPAAQRTLQDQAGLSCQGTDGRILVSCFLPVEGDLGFVPGVTAPLGSWDMPSPKCPGVSWGQA